MTRRSRPPSLIAALVTLGALALAALACLAAVAAAPAAAGPYVNPSPAEIRAKLSAAAVARGIPPRILYGVAYQESTWRQFDANGDPLIGDDGLGIGIMQVTTIPAGVDAARLRTDIDYNIAVGADILLTKWGYAPSVFPVIGGGSPRCYENWFFAVWAYNGWTRGNSYPYTIWGHIADGRGLWTGLDVTPVPKAWLVDGFPVGAGHDAAAGALVEPHAAAQARAERAASAEEGRGRRPVHRLRHALTAAPGRRALRGAPPLALERLSLGPAAHGALHQPRLRRRARAGRPRSPSPRPAAGSSSPPRSPTPTTPPPRRLRLTSWWSAGPERPHRRPARIDREVTRGGGEPHTRLRDRERVPAVVRDCRP